MVKDENASEAHLKLTQAVEVCAKFKEAFFDYKSMAEQQWRITVNALFSRLDGF
jgi:dynein heavy chain